MGTLPLSLATLLIIALSVTTVYARIQTETSQTSLELKAHHTAMSNSEQGASNTPRTSALIALPANNKR